MAVSQLIRSFNGGELSPYCDALTTSDKYATSCRVLENFIPTVYGPVNRRPGLEMIGAVKDDSQRVRLIPFVFSDTERYVMEFGDGYVRIFDAATGELVPYGQLNQWASTTQYYAQSLINGVYLLNGDLVQANPVTGSTGPQFPYRAADNRRPQRSRRNFTLHGRLSTLAVAQAVRRLQKSAEKGSVNKS